MSRIIPLLFLVSLLYPGSASAQEGEWPESVKTPRAEATRVAVAECVFADAALNNPANVRVYLIGLTVNDCEEAVAR